MPEESIFQNFDLPHSTIQIDFPGLEDQQDFEASSDPMQSTIDMEMPSTHKLLISKEQ